VSMESTAGVGSTVRLTLPRQSSEFASFPVRS
jgi:hypothetical protein